MAKIRRLKSKKFLVEVRKLGQYKSNTFPSKVQAMAWSVETEQNLSSDISLVLGKTLGDMFERYRDNITPGKRSTGRVFAPVIQLNPPSVRFVIEPNVPKAA